MKSPAFQWYPKDFLVDTQLLTAEQVGAYTRLLSNAWIGLPGFEQGYLPADPDSLARLAGIASDRWEGIYGPVLALFEKSDAQACPSIYHKRLLAELKKQKQQAKKREERAKKGAKARWGKKIRGDASSMLRASDKQCLDDAFLADADAIAEEDSGKGGRGSPEKILPGIEEEIPESLNTADFRRAWSDWIAYRREKNQTLKPTTVKRQLAQLEKWGPTVAVASIEQSILQGWTGIFEPKTGPSASIRGAKRPRLEQGDDWRQDVDRVMRRAEEETSNG